MKDKAELVRDDMTQATWNGYLENPSNMIAYSDMNAYCVNRRCLEGVRIAGDRLKRALEKEKLVVKKEGNLEIMGADASLIKRGFVDTKGKLYVYKGHDKKSPEVIATGQSIKLSKDVKALLKESKKK